MIWLEQPTQNGLDKPPRKPNPKSLTYVFYLLRSQGCIVLLVLAALLAVLLQVRTVSTGVPTAEERLHVVGATERAGDIVPTDVPTADESPQSARQTARRRDVVPTGVPMADERLAFTQITQALPNLSTDDLLSLGKTVHELQSKAFSDPAFEGQEFQAEAAFLEEPTNQYLTLDETLQLIKGLNPAELQVLGNLIPDYVMDRLMPYNFVGMRYLAGARVSAHWRPGGGSVSSSAGMYVVPKGVSLDDIQQHDKLRSFISGLVFYCTVPKDASQGDIQQPAELLKSMVDLVQSAQQAKAAGDQLKASELYEQAMSLLEEHGISGPMLEFLRRQWPV